MAVNLDDRWSVEDNNLSTCSYYGGKYSDNSRVVEAGGLMHYYLWNYLIFFKSFYKTGKRAATRPACVSICVLLFVTVLTGGIFLRHFESDPDVLNLSEASDVVRDKHIYEENFEEKSAYLIFTPINEGANLLTKTQLLEMMTIYEQILQIQVENDGVTYTYNDLCTQALGNCVTYGVLGFWDYNRQLLENEPEENIGAVVGSSNASYSFGVPIDLDLIATNVVREGSVVTSVSAFKFIFNIRHEGAENWKEIEKKWQEQFLDFVANVGGDNFVFFRLTTASRDIENFEELQEDWWVLMASYLLMVVMAMIILYRKNWVQARSLIVIGIIVNTLLAYTASLGFTGYMGTIDVPANRFSILLIFIFGFDHALMLMRNFNRSDPHEPAEERVAIAEQHTGMQLFVITLCVFVSYMGGSLWPLEGFHAFFLRWGLCILMEQQFLLTFFCSWFGVDVRRQRDGKNCIPGGPQDHGYQKIPSNKTHEEVFAQETIPSKIFKKYLTNNFGKAVVILLTVGMLAVGLYGMITVDSTDNFDMIDVYPKDKDGYHYTEMDQLYFGNQPSQVCVVVEYADFQDPVTDEMITQLLTNVSSSEYVIEESLIAWYPTYMAYKLPGSDFYAELDQFLLTEGIRYNVDLVRDSLGVIIASRFTWQLNPATSGSRFTDLSKQLEAKEALIAITSLPEFTTFFTTAYNTDWPLYESYPKALSTLNAVIAMSIFTLFYMEAVFLPPTITLSIIFAAVFTTVNTAGFFSLIGLGMNTTTGYWICLAWAFSTEYSVNFLYDFMSIPHRDKEYRAERALSLGSASIIPGIGVAILGSIPCFFGKSALTVTYPCGLWTVVFLAVWCNYFFLPVFHSMFGSRSINSYRFGKLPCV